MGFDYDKIKHEQDEDTQWTTYSDLFMVLSVVFLLLYVTSSMRNGTFGLQKAIEFERIQDENRDLKQQIKVYETLKQDYVNNKASQDDKKVYNDLMGHLHLLEDEASEEEQKLLKLAKQQQDKKDALNRYQQLIRNVVNANLISKQRINRRDTIIKKKDSELQEKSTQIASLEKDIDKNQQEIKKKEKSIKRYERRLEKEKKKLQAAYRSKKMSKKRYQSKLAQLKKQTEQQVEKLEKQKQSIAQVLQEKQENLEEANQELKQASQRIQSQEKLLAEEKKRGTELIKQIQETESKYQERLAKAQMDFQAKQRKAQEAFEAKIEKEKLSAKAKARRIAQFQKKAENDRKKMQSKLSGLKTKIKESQKALAKAKAKANEKKVLAGQIRKELEKNGIPAEVDPETGDVVLAFGNEYFDTGKSNLKPGMKTALERFVPIYAQSLLKNKAIAEKIESVEIVGFASPTFKGRFVDPKSLDPGDRTAVNYNLDLSYYRARSIFDHIFDTEKLKYPYQKKLLSLVKVSGRSFLSEDIKGRGLASGMSQREFCDKYDCKKSQRVIIKFDLDDK